MICPKCKSTRTAELAEYWSAYGLHQLGLSDPDIKIKILCMDCGFSVSACAEGRSDHANDQNIMLAVRRARRAFFERNRAIHDIPWETAIKTYPEILAYFN